MILAEMNAVQLMGLVITGVIIGQFIYELFWEMANKED